MAQAGESHGHAYNESWLVMASHGTKDDPGSTWWIEQGVNLWKLEVSLKSGENLLTSLLFGSDSRVTGKGPRQTQRVKPLLRTDAEARTDVMPTLRNVTQIQ